MQPSFQGERRVRWAKNKQTCEFHVKVQGMGLRMNKAQSGDAFYWKVREETPGKVMTQLTFTDSRQLK